MAEGQQLKTEAKPKEKVREKLEEWGNFIICWGLIGSIIAIAVIAVSSIIAALKNQSSILTPLTVVIFASICLVALIVIPFAIVVGGMLKVCEEE